MAKARDLAIGDGARGHAGDEGRDFRADSLWPSRLRRMISCGSIRRPCSSSPSLEHTAARIVASRDAADRRHVLGLLMRKFGSGHAGRQIGDDRAGGDAQAEEAGENDLRHGRHTHRIGAHDARHADFGRRFETRAGKPHIDALVQRGAGRLRRAFDRLADAGIIGFGQADEAAVARLADQRIGAGEIDVVGDQHHRARRHVRIDRAGGIGEDQFGDADAGKHFQRRAHRRSIAVLIIMGAAGQHQHRHAGKQPRHHFAGMAGDAALGKARQVGIGDADRIFDPVDKPAEARPQHQAVDRRQAVQPFDKMVHAF